MKRHNGDPIDPNSAYHALLRRSARGHEEVQVQLEAESRVRDEQRAAAGYKEAAARESRFWEAAARESRFWGCEEDEQIEAEGAKAEAEDLDRGLFDQTCEERAAEIIERVERHRAEVRHNYLFVAIVRILLVEEIARARRETMEVAVKIAESVDGESAGFAIAALHAAMAKL